jgi:hypothetical protein
MCAAVILEATYTIKSPHNWICPAAKKLPEFPKQFLCSVNENFLIQTFTSAPQSSLDLPSIKQQKCGTET